MSVFLLAAIPTVAAGGWCDEGPVPVLAAAEHYVSVDVCAPDACVFSVWVYEESNGIDGLQRDDALVDQTCDGLIESDTIVTALWQRMI